MARFWGRALREMQAVQLEPLYPEISRYDLGEVCRSYFGGRVEEMLVDDGEKTSPAHACALL